MTDNDKLQMIANELLALTLRAELHARNMAHIDREHHSELTRANAHHALGYAHAMDDARAAVAKIIAE